MGKRSRKRRLKKTEKRPVRAHEGPADLLFGEPGGGRKQLLYIAIVFVVALAIRLVYFYINNSQNPLFFHPVLDARFHHDWAIEIISGNFWGDTVFFRAPLYPYFLALLYKLGGNSVTFAVFVQHLIGSISCLLVYLLARQFFAERVSLVSGLLAALYWPLIYFEGDLLIVTLIVALDLVLLLLLTIAVRRDDPWLFLAGGLVMGLSAIARPSILIFLFVIPVGLYLLARAHGGKGQDRAWARQSILVGVGLAIVVAPVIVRNYVVGRDIVPIASQGGVNFYIGNNPTSNGSQARVPGARADLYGTYHGAIELAEQDVGRSLKPSEVSDYYFKKGLGFFVSSPGDALGLTMKKLYLFWAGVERSNSKYIQFFWSKFGLGRIPLPGFWLIGPLGLLGGVLLWQKRRDLALLYLFIVSYMIGVVVFFVNGRFRLPVAPVLIVFSSYSLFYLYSAFRTNKALFAKTLIGLGLCVIVVDSDYVRFRGVRALDEAVSHFELGNAYLKEDRQLEALSAFEEAYSIQQRYPTRGYQQIAGSVDYQLGVLYQGRGYTSRAIEAFERIHPRDPSAARAARELAPLYEQSGRVIDAIRAHEQILSATPQDATSLLALARLYKRAGNHDKSREIIDRTRRLYPNDRRIQVEIQKIESGP